MLHWVCLLKFLSCAGSVRTSITPSQRRSNPPVLAQKQNPGDGRHLGGQEEGPSIMKGRTGHVAAPRREDGSSGFLTADAAQLPVKKSSRAGSVQRVLQSLARAEQHRGLGARLGIVVAVLAPFDGRVHLVRESLRHLLRLLTEPASTDPSEDCKSIAEATDACSVTGPLDVREGISWKFAQLWYLDLTLFASSFTCGRGSPANRPTDARTKECPLPPPGSYSHARTGGRRSSSGSARRGPAPRPR